MQITQTTIEQKPIEAGIYTERESGIYSDIKLKLEEIINNIISPQNLTLDEEINNKFLELDFGSAFDVDATKIWVNDAIFFVNLLNQNQIINYTVEDNKITLNCDDKQINATQSLINMLATSYETKKPIRLDFGESVTVILKLDHKGQIQAHFIPGTPDAEAYLKQNIPSLRQIFDSENINYSYLGYSKQKENQSNKKRSNQ